MLVSLANMKTYLGITGNTYDDFLTEQLTLISSAVENYCGRVFTQTNYTQTIYKNDLDNEVITQALYLYHFPTISITSITETLSGVSTVLTATDYRIHLPTSTLYRLDNGAKVSWLSCGDYTSYLTIVHSAGFATIPPEIDAVVKALVEERYNKKVNNVGLGFGNDVQRVSIPGTISVDFDYSLQTNERKNAFGMLLGNQANVLDYFRSERAVIGTIKENYVA